MAKTSGCPALTGINVQPNGNPQRIACPRHLIDAVAGAFLSSLSKIAVADFTEVAVVHVLRSPAHVLNYPCELVHGHIVVSLLILIKMLHFRVSNKENQ
jgi:hypothetical protein